MQLVCPACGFQSQIFTDEPSGMVQCAGCGKRLYWGTEPRTIISFAPDAFAPPAAEDDIGFSFAATETQPTQAQPPEVPRRQQGHKKMMAGLVAALAVVMAVVMVGQRMFTAPVAWDQAHRNELVELKSTAESLALSGKLKESYQKYQQIISLVADHDLKDPVVMEVIASARAGQDRVFALMMSPQPAPAVTAAPAEQQNESTVIHRVPVEVPSTEPAVATTLPSDVVAQVPAPATTQATTEPVVVQLDPSQIAADNAPPLAGGSHKPTVETYTLADAVTDRQIGDAINKGVAFLMGNFVNGQINVSLPGAVQRRGQMQGRNGPPGMGGMGPGNRGNFPPPGQMPPAIENLVGAYSTPGIDALCVYALLNAGRAMDVPGVRENDPFTVQLLDVLKSYNMAYTYHRSLRAAALAVFNRTQDSNALEADVRWLQQASMNGGYTYTMPDIHHPDMGWDNSNSQYGLLGSWAGADAGKSVSRDYWLTVEKHWSGCALGDGTWPYTAGGSGSATMTCAGIASLLVARDRLDTGEILGKMAAREPVNVNINAGLNWLDTGDNCLAFLNTTSGGFTSYGLYGLERVGLASGFKYFGQHDWYSELAKKLVNEQHLNGSWGDDNGLVGIGIGNGSEQTLVDTAYTLLFLARGRHPILFNKLRYDGDWNNRPHDVAHLARFATKQLERPLNWQVVNLRRNWFDWLDSPVLYISGNSKPNFLPVDYESLRAFSDAGGLIFTHADGGSVDFHRWVEQMVRKVFPKYELTQVPADHAIYSIVFPIKRPPPKLFSVTNGSRLLMVDSPNDLAGSWALDWQDEKKPAFQLGVNLFVYAAGKRNFRNRLDSTYIPVVPDAPQSTGQVTRLQYNSEWDPEPYAWQRFARYFQWETHQAIVVNTVPMQQLTPGSTPMAVLTGTVRYDFTPEEVAAAKAYVEAGGVLMIDACGGQSAFRKSIETTLLPQAFAAITASPIEPTHPLLVASRPFADDLSHVLLRNFAVENRGRDLPIEAFAYGKGWVIFSRLDVTTGLLGTSSWGILGFDPAYAQALMKNAVLWAWARNPGSGLPRN